MAAGLSSFIAGTVGTLVLAAFAVPMTGLALKFGAAEYFALMTLGLVSAITLAAGSVVKAIGMTLIGILLGTIGTDLHTGVLRFTMGVPELSDGLGFLAIAMGVFGYAEIVANLAKPAEERQLLSKKVSGLMPTRTDLRRMMPAVFRGVSIGALLGVLPGGGATLASFGAYSIEKKIRPKPDEERFGEGNIRGVAGPEAANNSAAQTSFIPLLALGIPPNAVMALMVGAMMIHNVQPGPQVMTSNPALFWGLIVSMWIGNAMLLILNLPLIGIWVRLLSVPYRWLFPAIVLFCALGVFTANNNPFDVWLVAAFGVLGYVFIRLGMEPAPPLEASCDEQPVQTLGLGGALDAHRTWYDDRRHHRLATRSKTRGFAQVLQTPVGT